MEALLLLIVLTAVVGLVIAPAVRRRRLAREGGQAAVRAADPTAGYGLTPQHELDVRLPGPDRELIEALDETQRTGDWRPVGRLLAFTGDEWELRWQRVQSIAGAAAVELAREREALREAQDDKGGRKGRRGQASPLEDSVPGPSKVSFTKGEPASPPEGGLSGAAWLRTWRAQEPRDPGGAQVYAQFLTWQALADGSADRQIVLEEARNVCKDAQRLQADDPTPYVTELVLARHLGYRKADFESLWATVRRHAPDHMGAHLAALPYWSQQGAGSKEEADAFAQTAASHATQGSLLPALPLFAVHDHLPDVNMVRGLYQSAEIERAIEAAEFAVDQAAEDHPVRPHVLHLLVWFLVRAERYGEAIDAVQVVDGYVGALPWAGAPDPAAEYAAYRALALAGWEATGGARTEQPPTA